MNDKSSHSNQSWIERLGQALMGEPKDRDQLIQFLREAQTRGLFDAEAQSMIEGVLAVSDMQVRDILIPRTQMVVINRNDSPEDIIPVAIESGHSRFPVVGDDKVDVIGVLLAKDLLRYSSKNGTEQFSLRDILRKPVFVPESKRLNVLLKEFRASRNHMAIVVDEYGGVAGMVTIEDVLEQIVGEIEDEHDIDEDTFIRKLSDVSFTIKALTPVEDFNEYFSTEFSDEEFDTMGGLLTHEFGHLPKRGETIILGSQSFQVTNADNRRINLLKVTLLLNPNAIGAASSAD
ncbi:Magnesium and cobalt efflux protein CorC [hydrothermal vent metagenome]|uniref:Magnesium and cobalt efflux protein CorC n=1 Tax=hydrothermal vent metagenome TaxID=652676 RepID=A0A3B0Y7Z7_9ZZZZ